MARYSEAQNKASQRYRAKAYDRLAIMVKKGYRDSFKQLAEKKGVSLAGLITSMLIDECKKEGIELPDDKKTEV